MIETSSEGTHATRVRDTGPVDLRTQLRAIGRFWVSVVVITLLGISAAALWTLRTPPSYESTMTFFVATAADKTNTALQADEFAQRRINSYMGVVGSERLAQIILDDTGLSLTTEEVSKMITASVLPDTVLLNVRVVDSSQDQSFTIAKSIADNLDQAIGELDNRGTEHNVDLRVISGPTLNPVPVAPRIKLNLAIGLLIGLGLGIAQALLRQQLDTSVRSRDQLAEVSGYPTLGLLHYDRQAKSFPVLTPSTDRSRRAEAFRQLRTNLRFVDAASPVEVLVVTSSVESEGKTATAANLAVSFAEAGRHVLLIDADLRKSKLENYLDLEGSAGLTNVLIGEVNADDVIQEWGENGLRVLASGPIPPNPSELLGSPSMEKLIQELRMGFDLLVVDTPPVLPVTDAAVTATQADGVLLVVRHGRTHQEQVLQSIESLETVDARILGTVLSMAPDHRRDRLPSYHEERP